MKRRTLFTAGLFLGTGAAVSWMLNPCSLIAPPARRRARAGIPLRSLHARLQSGISRRGNRREGGNIHDTGTISHMPSFPHPALTLAATCAVANRLNPT